MTNFEKWKAGLKPKDLTRHIYNREWKRVVFFDCSNCPCHCPPAMYLTDSCATHFLWWANEEAEEEEQQNPTAPGGDGK